MHWYTAFGQRLASELPFPELRRAGAGQPFWTLRSGPVITPPSGMGDATLLGGQVLYDECAARLYRTRAGWRIVVDDTGVFELTDDCRAITWSGYADSFIDFARAHFLGRVLATAMHQRGLLVLHGSAVALADRAVAFLAPKHSGKSTLALALTLAGARLVSDDTLPVALGQAPAVWPGVASVRLRGDAAERLTGGLPSDRRPDGKYVLTDLPPDRLEERTLPLAAVYLLAPAESIRDGSAAARRLLPRPLAAAALVGQGKISEMLGLEAGPVLLQRAAALAERVPVYRLAVLRDIERLGEVVATVRTWHAEAAPGEPA